MKGEELKRRREVLGLNQGQAAEFLGVDRTTLARWERVEEIPRLVSVGANALLMFSPGLEEFVEGLKPAARRGVMSRREDARRMTGFDGVVPGGKLGTLPISDWPASCAECSLAKDIPVRGLEDCAGCPNLPEADEDEDSADNVCQIAHFIAPGCTCVECDEARRTAGTAPIVEEPIVLATGPAVEALRKTLRDKFQQFGRKGILQLSVFANVTTDDLVAFTAGQYELSVPEYTAVMDVIREGEGA